MDRIIIGTDEKMRKPFIGKVWKQGSSFVLTIPKDVINLQELEKDDDVSVLVSKIDKEKLKRDMEREEMRKMHSYEGHGKIVCEGTVIAKLERVFFSCVGDHLLVGVGAVDETGHMPKLRKSDRVRGVIFDGRLLGSGFYQKYNEFGFDNNDMGRYLLGKEEMYITTSDESFIINDLEFEPFIHPSRHHLDRIHVSGRLKSRKPPKTKKENR